MANGSADSSNGSTIGSVIGNSNGSANTSSGYASSTAGSMSHADGEDYSKKPAHWNQLYSSQRQARHEEAEAEGGRGLLNSNERGVAEVGWHHDVGATNSNIHQSNRVVIGGQHPATTVHAQEWSRHLKAQRMVSLLDQPSEALLLVLGQKYLAQLKKQVMFINNKYLSWYPGKGFQAHLHNVIARAYVMT